MKYIYILDILGSVLVLGEWNYSIWGNKALLFTDSWFPNLRRPNHTNSILPIVEGCRDGSAKIQILTWASRARDLPVCGSLLLKLLIIILTSWTNLACRWTVNIDMFPYNVSIARITAANIHSRSLLPTPIQVYLYPCWYTISCAVEPLVQTPLNNEVSWLEKYTNLVFWENFRGPVYWSILSMHNSQLLCQT